MKFINKQELHKLFAELKMNKQEEAFNELVIDPMYKDIIVAALTNRMPSLDSITGKGNGKIFLLFGSAGSGSYITF